MHRNKEIVPRVSINITPSGRFSAALKEAIEVAGLTLTEVARATDSTYENLRKLVGGRSYPSKGLTRRLAEMLGTNLDDWESLIEWDKLHREYGGIPKCVLPHKSLKAFSEVILKLSPEGRAVLLAAVKKMAEVERKTN